MIKTENILMYLRKSRADSESETIEEVLQKHERILQDFAIQKYGNKIAEDHIFREVCSGETIEDRPEIKKVMKLIESSNIKGILVVEPQRLTRGDMLDCGTVVHAFRYSYTLIITPMHTYNLEDEYDRKFFEMELSRGNDYLEYTKRILKRGKEQAVKEGWYIGNKTPYGWQKHMIGKGHSLKPHPDESKALLLAKNLRLKEKMGWQKIADKLEDLGYYPRNAEHWNPQTLKRIVLNPHNAGYIIWNNRKTIKVYENGKVIKKRPLNHDGTLLYKGKHDALFTQEEYDELCKLDCLGMRVKDTLELRNPLATLLYCKKCGRAMTYRTYVRDGKERCEPRLLCNNQRYCHTKSSTFTLVFESVIKSLEYIIDDFQFKLENDDTSHLEIYRDAINRLEKDLLKLEEKQEELYSLLEDKIYTREVFAERNEKLALDRKSLQSKLKKMQEEILEPIDYKEKIITFRNVIEALQDPTISAKSKNDLLKSIIKRIDYERINDHSTKNISKPKLHIFLK